MSATVVNEENAKVLPPDLESCHQLIRELTSLVELKHADIAHLKQRLHELLREKYGRSSEKLSSEQLSVFTEAITQLLGTLAPSEEEEDAEAHAEGKTPGGPKSRGKNGGGGRTPINSKLKRVRRDYHPEQDQMVCDCCGTEKKEIGVVIVEQLDYIPASFRVIEHATHKYACSKCQDGVVEGKRPEQIHNGGKPTEGLIAQISTAKFADHLPLYRQEQIYEREDVNVPRASMGRWLEQSADAARPIYERMKQLLLDCEVIIADESPVSLIDPSRAGKKSKKGYVWAYYGDAKHPYVIFDFQPDRCALRAQSILKGFTGFLLTDGYSGYEWYPVERSANCNVHSRRYFEKALKYDKKKSGTILALYNQIFKIEDRIKHMEPAQKVAVRQQESLPILASIHELLVLWHSTTPPKTTLGVAINYALARWNKLTLFTEFGCLRADTNLVENSIRPIALGRKNWMHLGGEGGLETASIHATLVNTCKRLGINPYLYLRDVFIRLGQGEDSIDDLLPDRWQCKNWPELQDPPQAESSAISVD